MDRFERKYENCGARMRAAFVALLQEMQFEQISVSMLCARAGVNRSTFYAHYTDMFELLHEIESEDVQAKMIAMMDGKPLMVDGAINREVVLLYLQFLYENKELVRAFVNQGNALWARQRDVFLEKYVSPMLVSAEGKLPPGVEYYYIYILAGVTQVVCDWARHGFMESPDELAEIIMSCVDLSLGETVRKVLNG